MLRGNWWELFGDPELNALEQQIDVSNQTLKAAAAQFAQARALVRGTRANLFPTVDVAPSASRAASRRATARRRRSTRPATTSSCRSTCRTKRTSGDGFTAR